MNDEVIIREIKEDEIDYFFEIFQTLLYTQFTYHSPQVREFFYTNNRAYTKENILWKIQKKDFVLGAYINNKLIGILIADRPYGGVSFLDWLMIDPDYQRKGIGKMLLTYCEDSIKRAGGHAIKLNTTNRNVGFYKKVGYELIGVDRKSYFGHDCHIFRKLLQEPNEEKFIL